MSTKTVSYNLEDIPSIKVQVYLYWLKFWLFYYFKFYINSKGLWTSKNKENNQILIKNFDKILSLNAIRNYYFTGGLAKVRV